MKKNKPNSLIMGTAFINFPEYEKPFLQFFNESNQGLMTSNDNFLSSISTSKVDRITTMKTPTDTGHIVSSPIGIEFKFRINKETIIQTDIEQLISSIYECASTSLQTFMPQVFNWLFKMCEESGQVINGDGKSLTYNIMLDALEKVEINFEENGVPILPTFYVNPVTAQQIENTSFTDEHKSRFESIINKKRDEFFATKRTRRLSK